MKHVSDERFPVHIILIDMQRAQDYLFNQVSYLFMPIIIGNVMVLHVINMVTYYVCLDYTNDYVYSTIKTQIL